MKKIALILMMAGSLLASWNFFLGLEAGKEYHQINYEADDEEYASDTFSTQTIRIGIVRKEYDYRVAWTMLDYTIGKSELNEIEYSALGAIMVTGLEYGQPIVDDLFWNLGIGINSYVNYKFPDTGKSWEGDGHWKGKIGLLYSLEDLEFELGYRATEHTFPQEEKGETLYRSEVGGYFFGLIIKL